MAGHTASCCASEDHNHGHSHGHSQRSVPVHDAGAHDHQQPHALPALQLQQVNEHAHEHFHLQEEHSHHQEHSHQHSHQHSHNHQHHEQQAEQDTKKPSLCLAVIREDGADIVIFDALGSPRTFSCKGDDTRKLCFSSHGNHLVDDLLTPCFDAEGNHGVPDELCFCGVETPHLHAHVKDPKTCTAARLVMQQQQKQSNQSSPAPPQDGDILHLATQTLYPVHQEQLVQINVSEQMPKQCNSEELKQRLRDHKIQESHTGILHRRRLHKVKHDDHIDYLVHNAQTGDLHLEHPCDDCGNDDVHGKFKSVGKRNLIKGGGVDADEIIELQFFEVSQRPFSVLEYLHDVFQIKSDRVAAVANIRRTNSRNKRMNYGSFLPPELLDPPGGYPTSSSTNGKIVRSTIGCRGICCSAECPLIDGIISPLEGVERVMINVPLRQVIIDHDPHVITATGMETLLQDFGAAVKMDGGVDLQKLGNGGSNHNNAATIGKSQFHVQGICCSSEIPAIRNIVAPLQGVVAVTTNTTLKTVHVEHSVWTISAHTIAEALEKSGFGAHIQVDAGAAARMTASSSGKVFVRSTLKFEQTKADTAELSLYMQTTFGSSQVMESFLVDVPNRTIVVVHNAFALSAQEIARGLHQHAKIDAKVSFDGADPKNWIMPELAARGNNDDEEDEDGLHKEEAFTYPHTTVILSGIFWMVSMLSLLGGNWAKLKYVALIGIGFGIPSIAIKALKTLRRYHFDTNCLMFFAAIGAVGLQEFAEAAAVVFLFALSEWLEVRATARARHALAAIVQLRPDRANLIHPSTKELIVVAAAAVPVGALVSVKTGDKVPCDGVVVEGTSTVDESSLTGESRPITKGPNDEVSGGTVNSGLSPLTVRTTSTVDNSAVSRLIRLVEEAQANRSETEKLVDDFAKVYTPVVVLAAILMCTIPWLFGKEVGIKWTHSGLFLIVVACPCALVISTPVSYVAGLAATAQKGILIKGGATLEALGMVSHVCFDKTGTLTNGQFALLELKVMDKTLPRAEIFQYLSLMEEKASHPVAQAILAAAKRENVSIPKNMNLQRHTIIGGEGISGLIHDKTVHVGNERLFSRLGLLDSVPKTVRGEVEEWKAMGGTIGYMSIEGHGIVCAYCAADGIREEASRVVGNLKRAGVEVTMLTGDNADAAQAIGLQAGLVPDEIKAKLLPEEKLQFIESLSSGHSNRSIILSLCHDRRGLALMCGDGVNDAPALAAANVGVAMGAGAALAMETADATLLDSSLEKLEYSMLMGRRVIGKIKQNVIFSLAVKAVVLGLAFSGTTDLWTAIGSDVGCMILVTLNAMLLLPRRQQSSDVQALKGDIEETRSLLTGLSRGETSKQ